MTTAQDVVDALKKVDRKKIKTKIEFGRNTNYGNVKDVCGLCEYPTGGGLHHSDCPFELLDQMEKEAGNGAQAI